MAYSLEFHDKRVVEYLRGVALSREGRLRLFDAITLNLRQHGDDYRADPERRLAPGSPYFWFHIIFFDAQGDRFMHSFRFVINDEAAAYGVLKVEYVDEERWPPPDGLF